MINIENRRRKTERLTAAEFNAFKKYVQSHITVIDATIALDLHRNTVDRVLLTGKGSPSTIQKIRERINEPWAA